MLLCKGGMQRLALIDLLLNMPYSLLIGTVIDGKERGIQSGRQR